MRKLNIAKEDIFSVHTINDIQIQLKNLHYWTLLLYPEGALHNTRSW